MSRGTLETDARQGCEHFAAERLLHSLAHISSELRRETSCQVLGVLLLCAQIDREEKLHESIQRGGKGKTEQAFIELNEKCKLRENNSHETARVKLSRPAVG